MANYVSITSDKKKSKVLFRCIVGGLFGWHYYYVGRIGRGILATCTMNFCMFGWMWDIWTICIGKFKDNIGQYIRE